MTEQKKDRVYLHQFTRARCFPSMSPYCAKLEIWLRMNDLDYKNVTEFRATSARGQKPYITINGEQVDDSTNIINYLAKKFNKGKAEEALTPLEKATAHAFDQMIEQQMFWQVLFLRSLDFNKAMFCSEAMLDAMPTVVQYMPVGWVFNRMVKPRMDAQGVGKRPTEENVKMTIDNLRAFSAYLGDKTYVTGAQPTRYDATVFGIIGQLYWTPMDNEVVIFVRNNKECANIRKYLENLKTTFWPDWEQVCGELKMNTENKKK